MPGTHSYTFIMSAKDFIHDAVKNALIKDGWIITADPFTLRYEDATVFADLAAEHPIGAEKSGKKIVVEVKSFTGPSPMQDLKLALGQYQMYFPLIATLAPEYKLYLAISDTAYNDIFQRKSVQLIISWNNPPLLVVNILTEEITQWIN